MKNIEKWAIIVPVSVVVIWLIRELYGALNITWSNGFTLQYMLIFYLIFGAFIYKERPIIQKVSIILGAVFCLVGDTFLASALVNHFNFGGLRMPLGMAGFFIGHAFWFVAMLMFPAKATKKQYYLSYGITFGILLILWFILVNNNFDLLSILSLVYCFALGAPLSHSIANFRQNLSFKLLAIFYAIFIFSDLLIGMHDIKGLDIPLYGFSVWFTYIIALSGISYSILTFKGDQNEKTNE